MASPSFLRSTVKNDIIGTPKKFRSNRLPTVEDVLRHYLWERNELMMKSGSTKSLSAKPVYYIVAKRLVEIWDLASIGGDAILSTKRIVDMIQKYHHDVRKLQKSKKRDCAISTAKIANFQNFAKQNLFDIAVCKCENIFDCNCEKQKKVPPLEVPFLLDQRTKREMVIGELDQQETYRRNKRFQRVLQRRSSLSKKSTNEHDVERFDPMEESVFPSSDEDFVPSKRSKQSAVSIEPMKFQLPAFASAVYRTKTSNRNAALLATSLLEDIGLVTPERKENVIDTSKIRREKNILATTVLNQSDADIKEKKLRGLYFDGRQDHTLTLDKKHNVLVKIVRKEEHVVLVEEPGSEYLGHVTPKTGKGDSIQKAILQFCNEKKIELSNLEVIGCDGTNVNTGKKNGVMTGLEHSLKKPLQRVVCLLHTNELPLRHLFQSLDGKSTGPTTFGGAIGTLLQNCETLPVKCFAPIAVSWINELNLTEVGSLSTDQQYLLDICKAVSSGDFPQSLADKKPGKLHQARWLTTASRTLRLYVADDKPSENLVRIVYYIMKVYAFVWFSIRLRPSIIEGPHNLFKLMSSSRCLDDVTKKIIDPVILRNAWFSHPENLLLSMISDPAANIRQLGWSRVLKARQETELEAKETNTIREFRVPLEIRLDSSSYQDIIDWEKCKITEPPLLKSISMEILKENIRNSAFPPEELKGFPCHTQGVERMVKLVTDAATAVCGPQERHKFILATIKSRKENPKFETKSSYKKDTK